MKRMRTISEAISEIRSLDPNSAITPYFIKLLCKENKIPHFKIGVKTIIDFDETIKYIGTLTEKSLD